MNLNLLIFLMFKSEMVSFHFLSFHFYQKLNLLIFLVFKSQPERSPKYFDILAFKYKLKLLNK